MRWFETTCAGCGHRAICSDFCAKCEEALKARLEKRAPRCTSLRELPEFQKEFSGENP